VQEEYVGPAMKTAEETPGVPITNGRVPAPEHLLDLRWNAGDGCESNREHQVVAQLLSKYKDVFNLIIVIMSCVF